MSDSGIATEEFLLRNYPDLRCDIIVKGQHYSGISGSEAFLDSVQPGAIVATSSDFPENERLEKSFSPLRDFVSSVHLHDNRGEKDEHLPPYDGTIDWPAAIKLLKTAPEQKLPLLLELKEKTGPEAPSAAEQLTTARKSMDRFEKAWNSAK